MVGGNTKGQDEKEERMEVRSSPWRFMLSSIVFQEPSEVELIEIAYKPLLLLRIGRYNSGRKAKGREGGENGKRSGEM